MKPFMPQLVYIEPRALEYPLGRELKKKFEDLNIEIRETTSHNQIRDLMEKMICKNIVSQNQRLW